MDKEKWAEVMEKQAGQRERSKNIYQLYLQNGLKCPFIVKRANWVKTAFVVETIGGNPSGPLKGSPPYHGNPLVFGHYINPETGELVADRSAKDGSLSCPGSFQWEMI